MSILCCPHCTHALPAVLLGTHSCISELFRSSVRPYWRLRNNHFHQFRYLGLLLLPLFLGSFLLLARWRGAVQGAAGQNILDAYLTTGVLQPCLQAGVSWPAYTTDSSLHAHPVPHRRRTWQQISTEYDASEHEDLKCGTCDRECCSTSVCVRVWLWWNQPVRLQPIQRSVSRYSPSKRT